MTNILPRRECVGATVNRQLNRTRNMPEPKYRKRMPDKVMTVVPPGWNPEKDFEYFEDVRGELEGSNYYQAAEDYVTEKEDDLEAVIDAAIAFYLRRMGRSNPEQHEDLSRCTKLMILEGLIAQSSKNPEYLERFAEDLQVCRDVEVLREETLAKYKSSPETTWLYELINLGDWSGTAAFLLDESILAEHGERVYKSPFSP